ncbi:MAG: DUF4339 domain-containing protein [Salinarimonadaceae bacterium]|nr:MAG: DUF4339 domain-containing protein [Salinarimonadaceae bacterium]
MRKIVSLASCVAVAALALPASGQAQETFSIPLIVDFEAPADADFHRYVAERLAGSLADGALVVEADSAPGNCRFATSDLSNEGVRAAFVDVETDVEPVDASDGLLRGAGLMMKYGSGDVTGFLAFLVNGPRYEVVAFVGGAVMQSIGGSTREQPERPVTLAARENNGGADFFLNGERIATLSDSRVSGRAIGLVHCGTGRFVFDDWGLNTTGTIAGEPETAAPAPEAAPASVDHSDTPAAGVSASGGPPPLPSSEWWVEHEGAPLGPLTLPELRRRLDDGRSSPASLVWREGMDNWKPAQDALD